MLTILIAIIILFLVRALTKKKALAVWVGMVLFIISAAKETMHNGDLLGYRSSYLSMPDVSYGELWRAYFEGNRKDAGYYSLSKLFSSLGFSVEVWFGIIALIFAVCVAIAFYKHSADPFISVIILFAFYFRFTLTGLRQTIAMGLVLLAYHYIKEKRLIPYLILITIAFLFHSSALIFLPAYWLIHMRVGYKQLLLVGGAFVLCYALPGVVHALMAQFSWVNRFQWYLQHGTGLNWSGYIIQLCLLIFCYIFRLNIPTEKRTRYVDPYINLMVIGLCLQGASSIIGEAFRLSYYYSMASMFALPNVITNMERNNAKLAYLGVCGVLVAYTVCAAPYATFTFFGGLLP